VTSRGRPFALERNSCPDLGSYGSLNLERRTMKCPVCPDTTLLMSERQGVEIDYCPTCRGVWLDRGELDKLIQLGSRQAVSPSPSTPSVAPHTRRPEFEDSDFGKKDGGHRRKSWLSDIFD
jgi:Zn-finger nucleic acid-binding protein